MEKGLIGILLICLVGSTVVVMLFLGERVRSPIELLKVEFPERFSPGEPNRFALNILARRDVEDIVVKYSYLYRVKGKRMEELLQTEGFNESVLNDEEPHEFLLVPASTKQMRENLPGDVGFETQKMKIPYRYQKEFEIRKVDLSIRFYDFREMMEWTPTSAIPYVYTTTTSFALVSIPEGNISYYEGRSDFYLNRYDSMSDLSIGSNDTPTLFLNPRIREVGDEYNHVNDGPPFGTVKFGSLKKGERAFLSFTTRDISLPAIQVIRFWVNGELLEDETQFNLLGAPL